MIHKDEAGIRPVAASFAPNGPKELVGVNDQFFLVEKLQRAIALHIDGVAKITVGG
jgi:hypothetical protein